ncbi:MAG: flavodoxin family protein [Pseudomonadota bacterium]
MPTRPTLLIVYHSQSGTTSRLAEAVVAGARDPDAGDVNVIVADPLTVGPDTVLEADGYLFGTPENFGYMSGALKHFFDRIYYPCEGKLAGRPYGLFVAAGNDGSGAISSVERIVTGLALTRIQPPLLCVGEVDAQRLDAARELGMLTAAGLDAGVF